MTQHELIITIVDRGFADDVMDAAKAAGARGGTILYGRGTGAKEAEKFFGISIQSDKELVLILALHDEKQAIMQNIKKNCGIAEKGKGITFSLPVDEVAGLIQPKKE